MSQMKNRRALAQQMIAGFKGSREREVPLVIDNCGMGHWPIQFEKSGRCKQCSIEKRRHEISPGAIKLNLIMNLEKMFIFQTDRYS
ncbi:hypothetical protein KUTeg_006491 [Tegillarca granosa]|uniref:Transposase n=1 Tax=Tegillarca granosa TaxID=220873 RepID=A0ABQ9FGM5_TEGGR|nr:hypothetical protein KUTeg_006491 [Tegillarca granosa]